MILIMVRAIKSIWQPSFAHSSLFTSWGTRLQTRGTRSPVRRIVAIQKLMMIARCTMRTILAMNRTANPATSAATAAKLGTHIVLMVS